MTDAKKQNSPHLFSEAMEIHAKLSLDYESLYSKISYTYLPRIKTP